MKIFSSSMVVAAMCAAVPFVANAQIQVGGTGSSAMFNTASLAAYQLAGGASNSSAGHYTASSSAGFALHDSRDTNIANQSGNFAIVWDASVSPAKVWYYLSEDSAVGDRAYFAVPRNTVVVPGTLPAPSQLISTNLWGADAATIPASVLSVLNANTTITAAFTDIRPEDALYATNRALCPWVAANNPVCLGYNSLTDLNVGTKIQSAFPLGSPKTGSFAQPVAFNVTGSDPISGQAIVPHTTVSIGVSPIVFIANRTNKSGLGSGVTATSGGVFGDITYRATAQLLFTGIDCDSSAFGASTLFPIYPILREPLSGTMNTFDFNVMAVNVPEQSYFTQEGFMTGNSNQIPGNFNALNPATNNPLSGACTTAGTPSYTSGPQGSRYRAIGTGEEVGSASNHAGVLATSDSIGYTFFSYGNLAPLAAGANNGNGGTNAATDFGYLTFATVDPINPSGNYNTPFSVSGLNWPGYGQIPTCTAPCPIAENTSFPNIRSGAYNVWSLLRAVADTSSSSLTNLQSLATEIQNEVNSTVPDFIPFNGNSKGDNGFIGYRIHFSPTATNAAGFTPVNYNAGNVPDNGVLVYQGNTYLNDVEAGGDVGGCLDYKRDPNQYNCRY